MLERVEELCTAMNRLAARLYARWSEGWCGKLPRRASVARYVFPNVAPAAAAVVSSIDRRERASRRCGIRT